MHPDFDLPSKGSVDGRTSSITAAFFQAITPVIPRHLSIKLCLSDSCGGLETRLEHGIELVKYGSDILGQAFPFALLERRDGEAELEL